MGNSVYFRFFEEKDSETVYKWMNGTGHFILGLESNHKVCREEALQWVQERMFDNRNHLTWAVCQVETHTLIGYASIKDIHYINRSAAIDCIVIDAEISNIESCLILIMQFLLDYVFERLNLNRVSIRFNEEQLLIDKLITSFSFKKEGTLRNSLFKKGCYYDEIVASLLAPEYFDCKLKGVYNTVRVDSKD